MIKGDRLVNEFMKYVRIDSETGNEGEFANFIAKELKSLGLKVWTDDAGKKIKSNGNNVYGFLEGDLEKEPILFSSHMDTVKIGNNIEPIIKDNVIYSNGDTVLGADDKSGIAAIIEAMRTLKDNNISHGPIEIVFSICEEGGLRGAKNIEYNKIKSRKAFILDSGGEVNGVVINGPAQNKMEVKIHGKASHAGGEPEKGISAIQVAADAISNMKLLRIDEETTANIGSFIGDSATNIVCPEVEIIGEIRSKKEEKLDEQTNHMIECFKNAAKKYNARVEYKITRMYDALNVDENDDIINMTRKAIENLGMKLVTKSSGGGSDANIYNQNGITAINVSTGMTKVHTCDEYIKIDDLIKSSELVLELMKR